MDLKTEELRTAHDGLAEIYAARLAGALERTPVERTVLNLFGELTTGAALGSTVGDIGCGTGRLAPYLAAQGLSPHGIDLSPEMIRVARRDFPAFPFAVADLRALPFADASLAGAVCWYSLLFLAPPDRPAAFAELARAVKPGGYLAVASKTGDGTLRRSAMEFDAYWLSPDELQHRLTDAGFTTVFWAGRPAEEGESSPQCYVIARRRGVLGAR